MPTGLGLGKKRKKALEWLLHVMHSYHGGVAYSQQTHQPTAEVAVKTTQNDHGACESSCKGIRMTSAWTLSLHVVANLVI